MKFLAKIVLVFFVFFQFTPSIIYLIDSDKDKETVMIIIDEDQEENSKENKELKEFKSEFIYTKSKDESFSFKEYTRKVCKLYLLKEYATETTQFYLPPKLV